MLWLFLPELRFAHVCWLFIVLRLERLFAGGCCLGYGVLRLVIVFIVLVDCGTFAWVLIVLLWLIL